MLSGIYFLFLTALQFSFSFDIQNYSPLVAQFISNVLFALQMNKSCNHYTNPRNAKKFQRNNHKYT